MVFILLLLLLFPNPHSYSFSLFTFVYWLLCALWYFVSFVQSIQFASWKNSSRLRLLCVCVWLHKIFTFIQGHRKMAGCKADACEKHYLTTSISSRYLLFVYCRWSGVLLRILLGWQQQKQQQHCQKSKMQRPKSITQTFQSVVSTHSNPAQLAHFFIMWPCSWVTSTARTHTKYNKAFGWFEGDKNRLKLHIHLCKRPLCTHHWVKLE